MLPSSVTLPGLKTSVAALSQHSSNLWEANAVNSLNDALLLSNNLNAKIQAALKAAQMRGVISLDAAVLLPLCRIKALREFI